MQFMDLTIFFLIWKMEIKANIWYTLFEMCLTAVWYVEDKGAEVNACSLCLCPGSEHGVNDNPTIYYSYAVTYTFNRFDKFNKLLFMNGMV